ncbi:PP2C-domain-containing protein [Rhizoclosmatium globosum]|uniref:protein-serine/threonine phosphatase n=1 Tax=Rhizoclosmatium globosum TaxID=329046 RepID=A0A1Y2CGD9_9FUNG|nr:Protein phosphatase 2C 2 [Rhizoclosmatium sp. JEL0117]ORY46123.1 PP2C-domain-containing protein [Rhizoclosmatium globosum]|eukprot:ORY46123.1 PP2C-domain-containing protein [Rhizoclosmatium globosum]
MGQTLSEPITDKHTSQDKDDRLMYAASSMQGWRITMEDAHSTILNLLALEDPSKTHPRHSFFAVYDGHGGSAVAKYSGNHLHKKITAEPAFKTADYKTAIKNGFLATDVDLKTSPEYLADPAGCTAVTVLITDDMVAYCGNAGDSRAVLSSKGNAYPLSYDHKPTNPGETARIRAAGGYVEFGRVNGNLALSRAVGDFEFKNNPSLGAEDQVVTVNPDIEVKQLVPKEDDFIVIACDGIWDCMSNDQVVDFVMAQIAADRTLPDICELMMEYCLAGDSDVGGVGCDNMTVVIVAILGDGKGVSLGYEEWVAQVKKRWEAKENKSVFQVKEVRGIIGGQGSIGNEGGDDSVVDAL